MSRRSKHTAATAAPRFRASVHGLDIGRDSARRAQRLTRIRNRIVTTTLTILLIAAVAGGGWFAYTAYVEHDENEQLENDRRTAEIERSRAGRTTGDIIDELESTPAWNGPGNPTFGVGDGADVDVDAEQP